MSARTLTSTLREAQGAATTLAMAVEALERALLIPHDSDPATVAQAAAKGRQALDIIGTGTLDVSSALRRLECEAALQGGDHG